MYLGFIHRVIHNKTFRKSSLERHKLQWVISPDILLIKDYLGAKKDQSIQEILVSNLFQVCFNEVHSVCSSFSQESFF